MDNLALVHVRTTISQKQTKQKKQKTHTNVYTVHI